MGAFEKGKDVTDKVTDVTDKVTDVTEENVDKLGDIIDKAADKVDEKTGGKHSEKIAQAVDALQNPADAAERADDPSTRPVR